MTKEELIARIAEEVGISRKAATVSCNAFLNAVVSELKNGGRVPLVGFGTFAVRKVNARDGRNPKTGETVRIAACRRPVFKAGKLLKDAVNEGQVGHSD